MGGKVAQLVVQFFIALALVSFQDIDDIIMLVTYVGDFFDVEMCHQHLKISTNINCLQYGNDYYWMYGNKQQHHVVDEFEILATDKHQNDDSVTKMMISSPMF